MARQRVEAKHPELVREALRAASRHCMMVFGVSDKAVGRALWRHYTQAALAEANEAAEGEHERAELVRRELARVKAELDEANEQLATALVQGAAVHEQLQAEQAEVRALQLQLEDARDVARVGYEPPCDGAQLYEVRAVRELGQAHAAVREGAALGSLGGGGGQLVAVRRAHVYGADSALVQASTVLSLGACVCTAEGLVAAGLPVPERGA